MNKKPFPFQAVSQLGGMESKWMLEAKAGDLAAFQKIYEKFKVPLMSYMVHLLQNRSIAEEVLQESFLKLYRAREKYNPNESLVAWLWTIARNTAYDYLRKPREEETPDQESFPSENLNEQTESQPGAEALLIEESTKKALQEGIEKLPLDQRDALLLRVFSELSYEEIAASLQLSVPAVKSLLFRAKAALVQNLNQDLNQDLKKEAEE